MMSFPREQRRSRIHWFLLMLTGTWACGDLDTAVQTQTNRSTALPILHVAKSGASREQARVLAGALAIEQDDGIVADTGLVAFVDPERFQLVPSLELGRTKGDEEGQEVVVEAIDFEAAGRLDTIDPQEATERFMRALEDADLLPSDLFAAEPVTGHSELEAVDIKGDSILEVKLDTRVSLATAFQGIPLVGPGANLSATFDGEGMATQLRYAFRAVDPGEFVEIIPAKIAEERCHEALQASARGLDIRAMRAETRLVYFAPALDLATVEVLTPFYECNGTADIGGEEVSLIATMLPATDDPAYVPQLQLEATAKGSSIRARVAIEGGKEPYSIAWSSATQYLQSSKPEIEYRLQPRHSDVSSETVTVIVTDANGIAATASQTLAIQVKQAQLELQPKVGGVRDYGTENAVTNEFGNLEQGFINKMLADGVTERFSWSGLAAWERDFKAPHDSSYVDNTDITFYVGHGYGGGFTFENNSFDDSVLDYNDATDDWGDKDLEWLALLSCQVLRDTWNGMSRFQRWKQEFDGLHLLLGFHTNAYAVHSFSGKFADNMLRKPFLWWNKPMKVREAWFRATDTDQPHSNAKPISPVVMGPLRKGDWAWNYNDYFWGKGNVGPDIRDGDIGGFWSLKVTYK